MTPAHRPSGRQRAAKIAGKVVPPAAAREAILWLLVVLCQAGYPVGPMAGQILTGIPVAAHHQAPLPTPAQAVIP